jgi:glutathione S-transferase
VIVLYQYQISPFCDKVRRILHLKRQPYEVVEVPPSRTPLIGRKNPARKLPFIEHDGRVIADSTVIALHLEETFPEPAILPSDPRERALSHLLEDWADESLYFYEMLLRFTLPHNAERWLPQLLWSEAAPVRALMKPILPTVIRRQLHSQGLGKKPLDAVLDDLDRHLDALDARLDGDWLVGSRLSLADIAVFVQLDCIGGADEGRRRIDDRPRLAGWMDRVNQATRS